MEFIEADLAESQRKCDLSRRIHVLPKRLAPTDEVLPHPRLRFVNSERHGLPHAEAEAVRRQALIVDSVPRFVQHAEECRREVMVVVARRQTAIARPETAAKGVSRGIDAASLEVEPDRPRRSFGQDDLRRLRIVPREDVDVRPPRRMMDRRDQLHQLIAQRREDLRNIGRRRARLVIVQQRVVRNATAVADGLRLFAFQPDHLFEPRQEVGKLGIGAGLDPRLLC